ncbi:uncharacterized protein LOC126894975 isoform X2 [Daktulosphaira vitifoliae]|nr:uncharacterized protein LOC126894975 isoform X2 [Daktulosphaira vitifoliae]XP_050522332.1 uncharacterized protein LOC126894975 isoform X2 [Daktulosphaira vitifoliae]
MINDIPSFENILFSDIEIQEIINNIKDNYNYYVWDVEKISKKIRKMRCSYSQITLYLIYHIQLDWKAKTKLNFEQLQIFKEYLHRILSIFYVTLCRAPKGVWMASITIDALLEKKILLEEVDFHFICEDLFNCCKKCNTFGRLTKSPLPMNRYKNEKYPSLEFIFEQSVFLKLSKEYIPDSFYEFYQFEDVTNIYSFIWEENFQTFIPSSNILPEYNYSYIEKRYKSLLNNWKNNYFALLDYTECIKSNLMLVTYYSLVRHCIYLMNMLNQSLNEIQCTQEELDQLLKIPMSILNEIGEFTENISKNCIYKNIIDELSSIDKSKLIKFTNKVIGCYNNLSYNLDMKKLDLKYLINTVSTNTFDYSKAKIQLESYVNEAKQFYHSVRGGMAPVDFTILRIFSYSCNMLT